MHRNPVSLCFHIAKKSREITTGKRALKGKVSVRDGQLSQWAKHDLCSGKGCHMRLVAHEAARNQVGVDERGDVWRCEDRRRVGGLDCTIWACENKFTGAKSGADIS